MLALGEIGEDPPTIMLCGRRPGVGRLLRLATLFMPGRARAMPGDGCDSVAPLARLVAVLDKVGMEGERD